MMGLLSLDEIKSYLGETSSQWDGALTFLNDAVWQFLKHELQCDIIRAEYTNEECRVKDYSHTLVPKNFPIVSVSKLTDSDGNEYTEGVDFDRHGFFLWRRSGMWTPHTTYFLSYIAGWETSELSDLKQVHLELIAAALKPYKDKSWGESSRSFPDGSVTKREEFELTPYQSNVLLNYRRPVL